MTFLSTKSDWLMFTASEKRALPRSPLPVLLADARSDPARSTSANLDTTSFAIGTGA
jgi:hypothetical protein